MYLLCDEAKKKGLDAEDYAPAAIPHLEAAVIRRAGSTVLLAVGDPSGVAGAVDDLH